MNITLLVSELKSALDKVSLPSPKSGSLIELEGVYAELKDQALRLVGTNLDQTRQYSLAMATDEPGEFVLGNRDVLLNILSSLPAKAEVTIRTESEKNKYNIKSGNFSAWLPLYNVKNFPHLPETNDASCMEIEWAILSAAIIPTLQFVAKSGEKATLASVNLQTNETGLDVVGTDGRALSRLTIPLDGENNMSVILPAQLCSDLIKLGKNEQGTVKIKKAGEQVHFVFGSGLNVWGRITAGVYPNYKQVIPVLTESAPSIIVPSENMSNGLALGNAFYNKLTPTIKIQFGETIKLECTSEIGNFEQSFASESAKGSFNAIINPYFLARVSSVFGGDNYVATTKGNLEPLVFQEAPPKEGSKPLPFKALVIIMPLRV